MNITQIIEQTVHLFIYFSIYVFGSFFISELYFFGFWGGMIYLYNLDRFLIKSALFQRRRKSCSDDGVHVVVPEELSGNYYYYPQIFQRILSFVIMDWWLVSLTNSFNYKLLSIYLIYELWCYSLRILVVTKLRNRSLFKFFRRLVDGKE